MKDEQREWRGISLMLTCSGAAKCNGMNETKEEQNLDRASGGFSETA